ncbi:MAG: PilT/PilU family type 4a pilus ATPase [Planctomycetota bacterium]
MAEIDRLFRAMQAAKGSDLHMLEGQPPKFRVGGNIAAVLGEPALTHAHLTTLLKEIAPPHQWDKYLRTGDCDFAYAMGSSDRFRANYYKTHAGLGAVCRIIPTKILTLQELNTPAKLYDFARLRSGLVLVTGPTGSGKSTTLAAIINEINEKQSRHILTVEEPIEFVHPNKSCIITQREVGEHTRSFASALRAAQREDCDVILVGEMRDLETIALAVSAAEMGVLVFGTLHTNSAAKTIDRLVNVFPAKQQAQIRTMLSGSLRGVVSQILCRKADGKGRVACQEIMVSNTAAQAAIRKGDIAKLNSVISMGRGEGMAAMDDAIQDKLDAKLVTAREAYMKALDKKRFEPAMLAENAEQKNTHG